MAPEWFEPACREFVELVTGYLEGALDEGTRRGMEAHLAACPPCRTYLEQMRATISATGRLRPESVSPRMLAELVTAFREVLGRPGPPRPR